MLHQIPFYSLDGNLKGAIITISLLQMCTALQCACLVAVTGSSLNITTPPTASAPSARRATQYKLPRKQNTRCPLPLPFRLL